MINFCFQCMLMLKAGENMNVTGWRVDAGTPGRDPQTREEVAGRLVMTK